MMMHCFVFTDSRISGKDTDKKNDNDIVGLKSTQIEKSLPVPKTGKDEGFSLIDSASPRHRNIQ